MRAYVCACARARERTAEIHYLSSTMDIYHPVVLFKFCTKRGASPLLTPHSALRRGRVLHCWEQRQKGGGGGEASSRSVSQSVRRSRQGRMQEKTGDPPPSSFPSLLSILRSGAFGQIHTDTEVSPQGETDQGRSDPLGTNGFPFSFFPLCIFFL